MHNYLPGLVGRLVMYAELLPLAGPSPAYPFSGFVLNLSVGTCAHRDPGDKDICVVLAFGDYEGGELCFYETGMVFNLQPGDLLVFPSPRLTHFNLHFKGHRCSLVLATDRSGDSWVHGFNSWSYTR